jgi:hypothetical protein
MLSKFMYAQNFFNSNYPVIIDSSFTNIPPSMSRTLQNSFIGPETSSQLPFLFFDLLLKYILLLPSE